MASNRIRKKEQILQHEERSIASFEKTTEHLETVTEKLSSAISLFTTSIAQSQKAAADEKKAKAKNKKETGNQKKVGDAMTQMNNIFGKKTMSGLGKLMGRENFRAFSKSIAGVSGGGKNGGFGKGMVGKAAKSLGSFGGSLLRMAGPIGTLFSAAKMLYDFWDSGGLAKTFAGIKMAMSKGSMSGPGGVAEMRGNLEGTEQFRKIDAKYAYQKPLELRQQLTQDYFNWEKGNAMDMLGFQQSLVKDDVEYEFGLRRDALQFQMDQAKETLDAELDKRKAIAASGMNFIKNYSSISERALKAIGSSTKQIIEGIGKFTSQFGVGVKESFQLTENAQGLAYHLGGSDEDVMNMTNMFRLMGKTTGKIAQNLIGGFKEFARINDIAPQVIFNQIKEAGEDIYKFSNGTADSFAKQAVLLTKMSVSMSQMMKASDTMVLNYKDSIKAEMSLSAMLGKNVNLSEVRAKLMAGDEAGGAAALKSALGGIDIGQMNAFQKQALTQATGMDISALMGLQQSKGGGVNGALKQQEAAGKAFADGALKQDIANAGAKLALEQEQRKKMLEFEQRQRLSMMLLEQTQKLDQIKVEAAWRAKWEFQYAKEFEKDSAAAEALVETATNIFASRGTKDMMSQAFAAYGIDTNTNAGSQAQSMVAELQKGGYLNSGDLANYTKAVNTALEGVKNLKDPKEIEAALTKAAQTSLGGAMERRQGDVNKSVDRIQNIANAFMGNLPKGMDWDTYKKTYNVSSDDMKQAKSILNSKQEWRGGYGGGYMETKYTGVDASKVEALRKSNSLSLTPDKQAQVVEKGNLQLQTEVKNTGQKQLDEQTKMKLVQTRELSEAEYGSAMQKKMVELLGINAQYLAAITEQTAGDDKTYLNGKLIQQSLLNQAQRNFAVARNVTVG